MATDDTREYHPFVLKLATVSPELAEIIDGRMRSGYSLEEVQADIKNAIGAAEVEQRDPSLYAVSAMTFFTPEDIGFLLCGEFEGNHMASWIGSAFVKKEMWTRPEGFDLPWYADEAYIANPDFKFVIQYDDPENDGEGDCTGEKIIGKTEIVAGLTEMAAKSPDHFADLISESSADAITYDVAMQYIVLGEVVYG